MGLLTLAILFGLFGLGAQPVAVGLIPAPWDKLAHGVVFAVLAVTIGLGSGMLGWRRFFLAFAGALLVGVVDEWHQMSLPGRQAGMDDLIADAVGSLLGGWLMSTGCRKWLDT